MSKAVWLHRLHIWLDPSDSLIVRIVNSGKYNMITRLSSIRLISSSFCKKVKETPRETGPAKIQQKLNKMGQFQSQIVPKALVKKGKSTGELRDAILYDDILNNQKRILLYDSGGIEYRYSRMSLVLTVSAGILSYFILQLKKRQPEVKLIFDHTSTGRAVQGVLALCFGALVFLALRSYRRVQKLCIDKIIFDTQKDQFQFYRRNWYGEVYQQLIPKGKVMYTQNQKLWRKGVNYYHLDTMEVYSISFQKGWIREDLFSHLISQRIKLHMKSKTPE